MERFVKGDVVVVPFPFTDLRALKRRPAMVAAELSGRNTILCQITSKIRTDNYSVMLLEKDFSIGKLPVMSIIRPDMIFTADKSIVSYKIGSVNKAKAEEVEEKLVQMFRRS